MRSSGCWDRELIESEKSERVEAPLPLTAGVEYPGEDRSGPSPKPRREELEEGPFQNRASGRSPARPFRDEPGTGIRRPGPVVGFDKSSQSWDQAMGITPISRRAMILAGGLLLFGLTPQSLPAQTPVSTDTLLAAARDMIEAARYCGLVTFDRSGEARVRTMDPFLPENDWTIWMGTNRGSRKVGDIEADPRVTLYYSSPDHVGYVAVYGTAELVDDPVEKASRWKDEWQGFYTDRETQYLLIRVVPKRLEVVDYARAIGGDPETWKPPVVEFGGK